MIPQRTPPSRLLPRLAATTLFAALCLAGCRNPGEEGQGQTRAHTPQNTPQANQPGNVPTPPTADQIDPNSPKAVLGGTSTTQPAVGNSTSH